MPRLRMPATVRASLAAATALAATLSGLGPASASPSSSAAARAAEGSLGYVAMGDSYSANVFVRPWDDRDGCGRSFRDYPHQVATELGLGLTDVTCGAAEVQDGILGPQPSKKLLGPPTTPPEGGWPEKPAQLDSLSPATDVVTVGIGGNTLGFGDIVTQCLERGAASFGLGTPCTTHYSRGEGKQWLDAKFAQLDAELGVMMNEIGDRAPNAKVAVVGYPAIVARTSGCSWANFRQLGTVTKGDMPWLDSLERDLNGRLARQAAEHGATYVDTYTSSIDHGVCASGDQKWMYGVKDDLTGEGDQTDPPAGLCLEIPGTGASCTFVHPNASGADNQAQQVAAALEPLTRKG
ncbi:lysophospholipase L1-like esterase [Kitasatospora sp. MAA4]|uniref:SGNH/GDSL hydrolase family protein n=1 Tax=Kitasatospora sp. MAA4 TaxID=3035093 RepID=UPI002476539C|nr:SGNH/GDSL hydrolase family protein [Kitasatospora sp. MAA4]MDH6137758.1 lysophospholipase L1-like esterase [Kitasatospora sp. MAA4]